MNHLLFIGGGHTHVLAILQLGTNPFSNPTQATLISEQTTSFYSGMIPGCVSQYYTQQEAQIDLVALCNHFGIRFIQARVLSTDPTAKTVSLEDGTIVPFTILSFDVGSITFGVDSVPGVRQHAIATRPISRLVPSLEHFEAEHPPAPNVFGEGKPSPNIVVVGGGVAGLELALCAYHRFLNFYKSPPGISVIHSGATLLADQGANAGSHVSYALETRNATIHLNSRVTLVEGDHINVKTSDGEQSIPYDVLFWSAGPAPTTLLANTHLALSARGYIRVRPTLQTVDHPNIFASGDCCDIDGLTVPKAGVFAVREAPVLAENLFALINDRPLKDYVPQTGFLSLLNVGDGTAIGSWHGYSLTGRAAWWAKDTIDRRFMGSLRTENLPKRLEAGGLVDWGEE